jgi:hypothetical protein
LVDASLLGFYSPETADLVNASRGGLMLGGIADWVWLPAVGSGRSMRVGLFFFNYEKGRYCLNLKSCVSYFQPSDSRDY